MTALSDHLSRHGLMLDQWNAFQAHIGAVDARPASGVIGVREIAAEASTGGIRHVYTAHDIRMLAARA